MQDKSCLSKAVTLQVRLSKMVTKVSLQLNNFALQVTFKMASFKVGLQLGAQSL